MIIREKLICTTCGGENVRVDAYALWNVERQDYELVATYDKGASCEDCDGECRSEFVPITDNHSAVSDHDPEVSLSASRDVRMAVSNLTNPTVEEVSKMPLNDLCSAVREAVLNALDATVAECLKVGDQEGWKDRELPDLFRALDAHTVRVHGRLLGGAA